VALFPTCPVVFVREQSQYEKIEAIILSLHYGSA